MSRLLSAAAARTVTPVFEDEIDGLPAAVRAWAQALRFKGRPGSVCIVPATEGGVPAGALLGLGARGGTAAERALLVGALAEALPDGEWSLAGTPDLDPDVAALGFLLGGYGFERYHSKPSTPARGQLFVSGAAVAQAEAAAAAVTLTRDLINTPASDMGPDAIEAAVRDLASAFGADVDAIVGDALIAAKLPMIHAVGRASTIAPRLVDLRWGRADAPKVTLVGKGVSFDTGGLDIKPASGMLLMKKDMGGAANVLGLAHLVMSQGLDVRLRVLIPAVENAIAGNAFRPGDVLTSRKGRTVEIGNTDAEGRLILADALTLADEEVPDILVDMATLTGAARVALGPDLPPFFTDDEALAADIAAAASAVADPLWRLPLHKPYAANLASKIADINNVTTDGFAGSITAALFLQGFVERARSWVHFDVYGWRPKASPIGPVGGEAQGIRALHAVLSARYPHP